MIYIFNGITGICQIPGKICEQCGNCMKSMNCNWLTSLCQGLSECCAGFTEKPLCSFVIITYLMVGAQFYLAFDSLDIKQDKTPGAVTAENGVCEFGADAWVQLREWLYGQMGFAVVGLLFAPYFQMRVFQRIMNNVKADPSLTKVEGEKRMIDKAAVQDAFKQIFLEDFGVLFYFIVLIGQLAWACKGETWIAADTDDCRGLGAIGWSAGFGKMFCATAVMYTLLWLCCGCCAGTVRAPDDLEGNYKLAPSTDELK